MWSGEVESALYWHPDVMEAAVVGVPEETWGEAILAVIVPEPGSGLGDGGEDALIEHCRRFVGGYKVPRRFRFVDALPRSALGKPLNRHGRIQPPRMHETSEALRVTSLPAAGSMAVSGGGCKIGFLNGGEGLGPLPRLLN